MSVRRSCRALGMSRTVYAYRPRPRDDGQIIQALTSLAEQYPRVRLRQAVPSCPQAGPQMEPQESLSRVLRPETEPAP